MICQIPNEATGDQELMDWWERLPAPDRLSVLAELAGGRGQHLRRVLLRAPKASGLTPASLAMLRATAEPARRRL
jgi:hypothetical protein